MDVAENIKIKLEKGLNPAILEVVNDSARHKGHAGDDGSGQTHFNVLAVAPCFEGKGAPERHRMIYGLLAAEFAAGLHALSIKAFTPAEYATRGNAAPPENNK